MSYCWCVLLKRLGDNNSNSSTRLTLLLAVMVVVMRVVAWSGTLSSKLAKNAKIKNFEELFGVSMDLVGSGWSETNPVVTCHFCDLEPPEHVPRTSARTHTCTIVYTRPPAFPAT